MGSQIAQLRPDVDPLANLDPVLLDTLTQNAFEMVSIIDTTGRILYAGGAIESMTGYTPSDRVGHSCLEFVHPDDCDYVRMRTRNFIDDPEVPHRSDSVAARLRHKDGSYRHVEITGTRLSRRGTPVLVVVHTRDVTQETRALERSAEAQVQVDMALWGGDLMIWQLDLRTLALAAHGMAALERRGIDPCIGANSEARWAAQIHPSDLPMVLDHYARQSRGELVRVDLEYRVRSNTDNWLWLNERAQIVARNPDGTAQRIAGVCTCIDEKRQLQQQRAEDAGLQSDIVENVPACIVLLNRELQIRFATRSLLGLSSEQLRGKEILPLFRAEWHQQIREAFTRSECEAQNVEIEGVAPAVAQDAGSRFRLHIAPAVGRDRASRWCVVIRDISHALRDQSRAFHALGQDQQRIGHDLREGVGQQLVGIAMLLQSLAAQLARQAHPLATEASQVAALINHSVDDVRALSRSLSPVGLAPTGLAVAIDGVAERARSVGGLSVEHELDIEDGHTISPIDADHLFGIIDEAVSNTMRHAAARHLWIRLSATPTRLELDISDDGCGLAAASLASGGLPQGLALMMHRARGIGATLSFGRRAPHGTSIRCLRIAED